MNPNTMTIDAIRDELARREGWTIRSDKSFPLYVPPGKHWSQPVCDHPIPATLDEAAKLPEGWEFQEVWRLMTGGLLAEASTPTGRFKQATGDTELLARFRLRLACTLADEGSKT